MDPSRSFERRIVSVLFADLVGFTSLSEGLDPEDVATVQDAYFAAVRDVVQRYGGQLEKFIGDAAMAVFGIPRSYDDDAERAIAAGLALIGAVEALSAQVGLEPGRLQVRVGINTGEVAFAESGPDMGRVTGDIVNVAARLQAAAQPSQLLVGGQTAFSVAANVELGPVEALTLKGKSEPVPAAVATRLLPRPDRSRAMGSLRAPLVGRDHELGQLRASLDSSAGPTRWLIVAPPGVGKSRLVAELAEAAMMDGISVWRAYVRPGGASPFEPIAQLVLAAVGCNGADPQLAAVLRDRLRSAGIAHRRAEVLLDEVLPLLSAGRHGVVQTGSDRDDRFAAWLETLAALGRSDGVDLWLVEDVHWAEPDLLAFLDAAVAGDTARVIVCTARPAVEGLGWAVDQHAAARRLDLQPLEPTDADVLVRSLIGDALPRELLEQVVERSDGNALFIEELLRSWISIGSLVAVDGGGWRLRGAAEELSLPPTVQAIYAAQLDDLPSAARRLARRASVAGRRFLEASLRALGAEDSAALQDLRSRALLIGPRPALLGETYAYRHALLRDAGYASLARMERADLHVRLARWLEAAAGDQVALIAAEIAQHYADALTILPTLARQLTGGLSRAELTMAAAGWLERSAERALATAAHETAVRQLRQSLDLTPLDDGRDQARRWLRLAEAIGFAGDMGEAIMALERSIDLYDAQLDAGGDDGVARDGYARAVALHATLRIEQLQFAEAAERATAALERIGSAEDDLPVARLLYVRSWAQTAYSVDQLVEADLERAASLAVARGDADLEMETRSMLDDLRAERGEVSLEEYRADLRHVHELALAAGNIRRAGSALRGLALTAAENESAPIALGLIDTAAELAQAHGLTEDLTWAEYARSEVHFAGGDWDAARRHGLRALELAERNAYLRPIVRTWFVLTAIAHAQGRVDELSRAYAWFDPRRSMFPDSPFGRLMHGAVDSRAASHGLRPGFLLDEPLFDAWADTPGLPSWYAAFAELVGGWIGIRRFDEAGMALRRMREWERHPLASRLFRANNDLVAGQLALARDNHQTARDLAARAAVSARTIDARWWLARALRLAERAGSSSAADIVEAIAIERQLGLTSDRG